MGRGRKNKEAAEPLIYYFKGRKKRRFLALRIAVKVFLSLFVFGMTAGFVLAVFVYYKYGDELLLYYDDAVKAVAQSSPDMFKGNQTGYVYDSAGSLLVKLKSAKDSEYVTADEVPESVLNAFVAIEDKRFWSHHGVDWKSTLNAAYLLVKNDGEVKRGGSTITQQLARNEFLSFEVSYERKLREIFTALQLEKKYSKKQILEFYINDIYYANQYYGIGAAAKGYFGKGIDELDYGEVAFLCAIPNNPTYYDPRTNFDHTISRRNLILREMYSQGYLTEQEYLTSVNAVTKLVDPVQTFYNYQSSYALDCAVRSFMEISGFEFRYTFDNMDDFHRYRKKYRIAYEEAKGMLYAGGYKVYTSLNADVQNALQDSLNENLAEFTDKTEEGEFVVQGAGTVIDNEAGLVLATVGGRSDGGENIYTLNRAFQSFKQPGSTIKPLIVYTPAMEAGYTPDSIVNDSPIEDGPKNSNEKYMGNISLRTAVEKSKNVVAWRLFEEIKPETGLSKLSKMQFTRIVPDDYTIAASLGGLTYGVSTVEMASAYSCLANDGIYREPTCIVKIENRNGVNVMPKTESVSVFSRNAAHQMIDVLQGVGLRGTAAGLSLGSDMPVACKTGTTNEQKAGWFCGTTPYYSVAVYVGADREITIDNLWGNTYPCYVWRDIQSYLNSGKEVVQFDTSVYDDVVIEGNVADYGSSGDEQSKQNSFAEEQTMSEPAPEQEPAPEPVPALEPESTPDPTPEQEPAQAPEPEPEPEPAHEQEELDSLILE